MNYNFIKIIGIFFLFLGLLWLNSYELLPEKYFVSDSKEVNSHLQQDNSKILLYSLLGLIPTVLGIFLLEYTYKKRLG